MPSGDPSSTISISKSMSREKTFRIILDSNVLIKDINDNSKNKSFSKSYLIIKQKN